MGDKQEEVDLENRHCFQNFDRLPQKFITAKLLRAVSEPKVPGIFEVDIYMGEGLKKR